METRTAPRSVAEDQNSPLRHITPCLWFDDEAEDAANFYVSIFPNSHIRTISRYGAEGKEIHGKEEGTVMTVAFTLDGQDFVGLNGGPHFTFDEAVSFQIPCADQEEVDYYWARLSEGGQEGPCGMGEGQVRPVLAGGAQRYVGNDAGYRFRKGSARHSRVPADEEVRHRATARSLRRLMPAEAGQR